MRWEGGDATYVGGDKHLQRSDHGEKAHLAVSACLYLNRRRKHTLLTMVTLPSTTSPLKGFITMAV